ncbi:MAG: hypothetical protein SGBAC_007207 [Bacillariaceae sp.]
MGGLDPYQKASIFGYDDWLDAVPIDLHGGQLESVVQVDFFDYAHDYCTGHDMASKENSKPRPFDASVMSLEFNFQGDPRLRGDMLALAADPRLLKRNYDEIPGMIFVALPSASLDQSRYCDMERFIDVVTNQLFHLELVETKCYSTQERHRCKIKSKPETELLLL